MGVLVLPAAIYVGLLFVPGFEWYVVTSGSMAPAIPAGSLAAVADTGSYEVGDVVTFERAETVVTHRIVDDVASGYVTKGDANEAPDEGGVSPDAVRGEVVAHVPGVGSILASLDSTAGYFLFVLVPSALLIRREVRVLIERIG